MFAGLEVGSGSTVHVCVDGSQFWLTAAVASADERPSGEKGEVKVNQKILSLFEEDPNEPSADCSGFEYRQLSKRSVKLALAQGTCERTVATFYDHQDRVAQ